MINESTTDGTLESLLLVTKLAAKRGVFNNDLIRQVGDNFIAGIRGSITAEISKVPKENQQEFKKLMGYLLKPMSSINTVQDLVSGLTQMIIVKKSVFKRFGVSENINEGLSSKHKAIIDKVKNSLKQPIDTLTDFWNKNGKNITIVIAQMLVRIVIGILKSVISKGEKKWQ